MPRTGFVDPPAMIWWSISIEYQSSVALMFLIGSRTMPRVNDFDVSGWSALFVLWTVPSCASQATGKLPGVVASV